MFISVKLIKSSTGHIDSQDASDLIERACVVFLKVEPAASIQEYTKRKKGLSQEENKHGIFCGLLTRMPQ